MSELPEFKMEWWPDERPKESWYRNASWYYPNVFENNVWLKFGDFTACMLVFKRGERPPPEVMDPLLPTFVEIARQHFHGQ